MWQKQGLLLELVYNAQVTAVTKVSGLASFRIEANERTLEDWLGALPLICTLWALWSAFGALLAFPEEKQVLNKNRAGNIYRLRAYGRLLLLLNLFMTAIWCCNLQSHERTD